MYKNHFGMIACWILSAAKMVFLFACPIRKVVYKSAPSSAKESPKDEREWFIMKK